MTREKREEIERLANDEWEDESEFDAFFAAVSKPTELHLYASLFNWDCGVEELERVVTHPICDRGTALMIYWRSQPDYYLKYSNVDEMPLHEREGFELIQHIQQRISAGAYQHWTITYDPRNDQGHDLTPHSHRIKRYGRDLPKIMYQKAP